MSRHDYIPSRQVELRSFVHTFDSVVGQNPARFGLMVAEWQSLHERISEFDAALTLAMSPPTRNVTTIEAKELARVSMLQLLRPIAQRIKDNMGVAPEDKLALGLTLPGRSPHPIPAPQTAPVLEIWLRPGFVHLVRYHDEPTPHRAARAAGATGLQLVAQLSPPPTAGAMTPPPPADGPDSARFVAQVTRQHYRVQYDSRDAWKTAHYWARWQTARGLVGPWSSPVTRVVAA